MASKRDAKRKLTARQQTDAVINDATIGLIHIAGSGPRGGRPR